MVYSARLGERNTAPLDAPREEKLAPSDRGEAHRRAIINDLNNFSGEHIHDDQTLIVIKFRNDQPNLIL